MPLLLLPLQLPFSLLSSVMFTLCRLLSLSHLLITPECFRHPAREQHDFAYKNHHAGTMITHHATHIVATHDTMKSVKISRWLTMIFHGIKDQTVELKILGYASPIQEGYWIDNTDDWLRTQVVVDSLDGQWTGEFPSLLVRDLSTMIEWFECLERNVLPPMNYAIDVYPNCKTESYSTGFGLGFIEPNICFVLLRFNTDTKLFRIYLDLEFRPHDRDMTKYKEKVYHVDCLADKAQLSQIVNDLKQYAKAFPPRYD